MIRVGLDPDRPVVHSRIKRAHFRYVIEGLILELSLPTLLAESRRHKELLDDVLLVRRMLMADLLGIQHLPQRVHDREPTGCSPMVTILSYFLIKQPTSRTHDRDYLG